MLQWPNLFSIRTNNVRRILIDRDESVAEMHSLEVVRIPFLDCLSTVNGSFLRHKNRVLSEERGKRNRIVVVVCVFKFLNERNKPLT
jgi:hypothetical protein